MLPGPSSRSTTFDDELRLRRFPLLIVLPQAKNLIPSLCHIRGFNNFSLHPSFCLISSMSDYNFMKPLDKCAMIIINILSSSKISIKFMMGNTILSPQWLCYHRKHSCLPPTQTCSCYGCNLLSSLYDVLPWSIIICYVKNVVRITPPLKNSWYSDTSHHHHSFLVLVLIRSVMFGFCPSSNHIALKIMVGRSLLDYLLFLTHHSDIGRATQPIFRAHLSTNV